jgi:quinol monooxygenase YgiN
VTGFTRPIELQSSKSDASAFYFWTGTYTAVPGERDAIISILSNFSSIVEKTESETLSYVILIPTDVGDQNTIYLWEQYSNESGLIDVHVKSDAASKLKDQIGHLLGGRSMAGYRRIL